MKKDPFIHRIIPAVRMLCQQQNLKSVYFAPELASSMLTDTGIHSNLIISDYPDDAADLIENIKIKLSLAEKDKPVFLVIKDKGTITICNDAKSCRNVYSQFKNAFEGNELKIFFKNLNPETVIGKRKVENKIAVITGGAQGFGEGITRDLFNEGANIVIADINEEKARFLADELNSSGKTNVACFFKTDVSNPGSIEQMIDFTVKEFGGLDLFISNAGILRAGSLEDMDENTFDLMTKINYSGYYYCAKYASRIMKSQWEVKNDYFTDIIQINSKSGLKGSNKNFAYAGGKFGGVGLTQSFALELMPYNIKVNSVCPGNFFDGPLWSDPENGLFVQYLKTGKVPGAKTIAEVKKFYEAQVPANRGCMVKDVMKAIYYAIDQEYETGQAIPVTGGQNMLK